MILNSSQSIKKNWNRSKKKTDAHLWVRAGHAEEAAYAELKLIRTGTGT